MHLERLLQEYHRARCRAAESLMKPFVNLSAGFCVLCCILAYYGLVECDRAMFQLGFFTGIPAMNLLAFAMVIQKKLAPSQAHDVWLDEFVALDQLSSFELDLLKQLLLAVVERDRLLLCEIIGRLEQAPAICRLQFVGDVRYRGREVMTSPEEGEA